MSREARGPFLETGEPAELLFLVYVVHPTIRSGTNRRERYGRTRGFSCSSHRFAAVHIRRVQDRLETYARVLPSSAGSAAAG